MNEKQIQQVLEIEKQSQEIHAKAQREAQELPVKAEQEAQAMIAKAKTQAEEAARKLVAQAQAEGGASQILSEAEKKNTEFETLAKKNLDKAVAYVLDRVTGKGEKMAGGVSGYAAISARVRAMYAELLSPQDMARLNEAADFQTLFSALKSTSYGPYLEGLKDKEITPRRVTSQVKKKLAASFYSVIQMSPVETRPLVKQLFRYFEIGNLKAVLRSLVTVSAWSADGAPWDRVRDVLFPLGTTSTLPAQAMVESGSIASAVDLLHGTPYEDALSFAMKRYSAEQNLFPLEVALDLSYWRRLWAEAKKLTGQDREHGVKIIGSLLDMNNLMWAIRYRVYHKLSEEEIINYTLPFGYRVKDSDLRSIAAGADPATVIGRIYPGLSNLNELLEDAQSGLSRLEVLLKRQLMKQCLAAFVGSPFHIGIPLAFLVMSDLEVQDLIVLVEAKSSNLPEEEYRQFLLKSSLN